MGKSRTKTALLNSGSRFIYEIVGIICSIIVPRLILISYGSDVNGLVLSITRFLSISTFMDAAIGGVCRAALYGPLSRKDHTAISKIYVSASSFYSKIGIIFLIYTAFVGCLLPLVNSSGFDFGYILALTVAISVSYIAQFLIGATNSVLIYADQKVYLTTNINTATLILNTLATFIMIKLGVSIQVVKLVTSIVFAIRPIFAYFYCKRHYQIDKKATYDADPIPNKWAGFSHQIAETVHNNVSVIMLTVVSVYSNVSIYSVYALVTEGLSKLIECIRSGMGPTFGNMLVTESTDTVRKRFGNFDWITNVATCILYSTCAILLIPFIRLYTSGVSDANYIQPLFGLMLIVAAILHNMKHPYLMIVIAAGHFKETQMSAYIEAILNVVVSFVFVWKFGLIGVAVGLFVATLYRLIYLSYYVSKNIIYYPMRQLIIKLLINMLILLATYFVGTAIRSMVFASYLMWAVVALVAALIISLVTAIVYSLLFRSDFAVLFTRVKKILKRR